MRHNRNIAKPGQGEASFRLICPPLAEVQVISTGRRLPAQLSPAQTNVPRSRGLFG